VARWDLKRGASSPGSTPKRQCDLCHHLTALGYKIKDVKTLGSGVPSDATRAAFSPGYLPSMLKSHPISTGRKTMPPDTYFMTQLKFNSWARRGDEES